MGCFVVVFRPALLDHSLELPQSPQYKHNTVTLGCQYITLLWAQALEYVVEMGISNRLGTANGWRDVTIAEVDSRVGLVIRRWAGWCIPVLHTGSQL